MQLYGYEISCRLSDGSKSFSFMTRNVNVISLFKLNRLSMRKIDITRFYKNNKTDLGSG